MRVMERKWEKQLEGEGGDERRRERVNKGGRKRETGKHGIGDRKIKRKVQRNDNYTNRKTQIFLLVSQIKQ